MLSIIDRGSLNGTMVNGKRITACQKLSSGDVIAIGSELLHVIDDSVVPSRALFAESSAVAHVDPFDDTDPTDTNRDQVGVIELIVEGAGHSPDRRNTAPALCHAIDDLAAYFARSNRKRDDTLTARSRLRRSALDIVSWFPDGGLDAWYDELETRLFKPDRPSRWPGLSARAGRPRV